MKTKMIKIALIVCITLGISCSGSSNDSGAPAINDNFIRAKVNGVQYEATGTGLHGGMDGTGFDLDSRNSSGTGMDFYVIGPANPGTYTFSTSNVTTQGRLNYRLNHENFTTGFCGVSNGTLTITSNNGTTIQGTFSFTGSSMSVSCASPSTKIVTEGSFKVTSP